MRLAKSPRGGPAGYMVVSHVILVIAFLNPTGFSIYLELSLRSLREILTESLRERSK